MASFVLSFFPLDVLDGIWDLIDSVSDGFLNLLLLNHPKSAAMGVFQGTQEQDRNSHGKRAISVRAIEFLLY